MKGELHQIRRHSRTRSPGATRAVKWLSVCAALLVSYAASLPARAESDAEAAIRMCWEEAAEARLNRGRDMPEAKSVQELLTATAGNPCREAMSGYLRACLKTGEEQGDQYPCIGAASWICRSSQWATSDIRRTACVEAEQNIWRELLEDATTTFATFLDDEKRAARARMWQSHVELRNSTCALVRAAFEGADPSMHNANCVLHAEARLVVDLRDMLAEASGTRAKSNANGAADKTETTPPPARSDPPRAPSAPNKSEKWGALAFTAGGSYASAWQHSTKAEAEADVLKCRNLDLT